MALGPLGIDTTLSKGSLSDLAGPVVRLNGDASIDVKTPYQVTPDLARKMQEQIKGDRWNGVGKDGAYRYSFSILKASPNGTSVPVKASIPGFNDSTVYLRIPPQNITISTQYAAQVSATNRGILEEHNGVVFRMINITGTTGVFPDRLTVGQDKSPGKDVNVIKNLFPNAYNSVKSALNSWEDVKNSVSGPPKRDLSPEDKQDNPDYTETGYYKFWVLHNFMVAYAEAKKAKDASDLRFVFNSPKDNISYVCTPISFDLKRNSAQPLLYNYTIILKCWDVAPLTVGVDQAIDVLEGVPSPDNIAAAKAITETLRTSRQTIAAANRVLSGVHSDISSIMNIYTQGVLLMKDLTGLADEVIDFIPQMVNNAETLLIGPTNSLIRELNSSSESTNRSRLEFDSVDEEESYQTSGTTKSSIQTAGQGVAEARAANTNIAQRASAASQLKSDLSSVDGISTRSSATTPDGETFPEPTSINRQTAVGRLDLLLSEEDFTSKSLEDFQDSISDEFQNDIEEAREEALQLTSGDIRDLVDDLQEVSNNFAESVGGGDEDYNSAYYLTEPEDTDRELTEDDIITQVGIQESIASFASTLGTGQIFEEREGDPFVNANVNLDINDQMYSPLSSIPVPFQRGGSLELLAQQYLGDPNRAREIHLLNHLRPPFIDEVGFTLNISSADGRTFIVTDASDLAIGQVVTISGTLIAPTRRRILNLEDFGDQTRVTVDGPDNLSIYTPATNPYIEARLPGTVGPGDTVLIPSDIQPNTGVPTRPNEIEETMQHAEKVFKIDLLLDNDGKDLIVGANGDVGRSYGYTNALQALRLATEIERGEIEQHTSYGLGFPLGSRNSDFGIQDINDVVSSTITSDSRFNDAITEVEIDGSVTRIRINASGAAGTGQVPVEFEVGQL
jgi:hypothetical protein